jgi:hypothetical protein
LGRQIVLEFEQVDSQAGDQRRAQRIPRLGIDELGRQADVVAHDLSAAADGEGGIIGAGETRGGGVVFNNNLPTEGHGDQPFDLAQVGNERFLGRLGDPLLVRRHVHGVEGNDENAVVGSRRCRKSGGRGQSQYAGT